MVYDIILFWTVVGALALTAEVLIVAVVELEERFNSNDKHTDDSFTV